MNVLDIAIANKNTKKSLLGQGAIQGKPGTPGEDGYTPSITENSSNREDYYRLDIINKDKIFTTPNLMGVIGMEYKNKAAGSPVGEIISYMGTTAPPGYLICDGSIYQIADYPHLAKHFKDNFGSENHFGGADGAFAVPDLRGEFLRGTGTNGYSNQGNGSAVGAHQNATIIPNVQSTSAGTEYISGYVNTSNYPIAANIDHSYTTESGQSVNKVRTSSQTAKDINEKVLIKYSSRPTNTSVLYCIKCKPNFSVCVQHTYSFDEHVVGTWLDGKQLYEKTVNFGSLPNNDTKCVPHGVDNADVVYVYDGFVKTDVNNGNTNFSTPINVSPANMNSNWNCWCDRENIYFHTGVNRTTSFAIVTLRYTKSTD